MQQHGGTYFDRRLSPPWTLGVGLKGQNLTFSERGHVAYQMIWNHECSNLVPNIPPPDLGMVKRSRINFFQKMVMLHIKLNGITNAATWFYLI